MTRDEALQLGWEFEEEIEPHDTPINQRSDVYRHVPGRYVASKTFGKTPVTVSAIALAMLLFRIASAESSQAQRAAA